MKIIPSNITYLIVQFDVLVDFHYLNNEEIILTNLKAETTYSFYIIIDKMKQVNLTLEIYGMK